MKCNCTCDQTSVRRRRNTTRRRRVYAKNAKKWSHKNRNNRKNKGKETKMEYFKRLARS